jgi:glc operon protein GlcG
MASILFSGTSPRSEISSLYMRTLETIDYSEAKRAVDLIVEEASKLQKAAAIAVADSHGDLICLARMDGAPVSSIQIAMNKAWTAARERKPTKEIGEKVRHPEKGHDIAYYGDPRYVGWGGGVPVLWNGKVVGAVAVSGLSSNEDVALATLGVDLISRG